MTVLQLRRWFEVKLGTLQITNSLGALKLGTLQITNSLGALNPRQEYISTDNGVDLNQPIPLCSPVIL